MPRPLPTQVNNNRRVDRETMLERLIREQFGKCYYCKMPLMFSHGVGSPRHPTIDHKTPRSCKGSNHYSNYAAACVACNLDKGALDLDEYELVLTLRRFWATAIPMSGAFYADNLLDHFKIRVVQDPFFAPYPGAKKQLLRDRKKGEPRRLLRTNRRDPAWMIFFLKPYHRLRRVFFTKKGRWKYPLIPRKESHGEAETG